MQIGSRYQWRARVLALLIGGAGLLGADTAFALSLKLQVAGDPNAIVLVDDNGPGDADPAVGSVSFVGAVGPIASVVATGVSRSAITGASRASFVINVVSSTDAAPATLLVTLTDRDVPGTSGAVTVVSTVGGRTSGDTLIQGYVDPDNTGATTSASTCTAGPQGPASGAFDNTASTPCVLTGPVSVTFVIQAQLGSRAVQGINGELGFDVP